MLFGAEGPDQSLPKDPTPVEATMPPEDQTPVNGAPEPVQPPEEVTPGAPAGPEAPQPPAVEAQKTPEQLKTDIDGKAQRLIDKVKAITDDNDKTTKYTKKLVEGATDIQKKAEEIQNKVKALDATKPENEAALKQFDDALKTIEEGTKNMDQAALDANIAAKTRINEKRTKLEEIKTKVTGDKVFDAVLKELGVDTSVPEPIKEALKAKFDPAKFQTETIDAETLRLEAFLNNADNETDIAKIDAQIAEFAKDEDLTPESFDNADFVKAHKPILEEVARLQALGGDGKACKAAKEAMATAVGENIKGKADMTPEMIKQEYEQSILIGHVCDVLNSKKATEDPEITPESIQKALRYYELGKHESGKEGAEAKKILDLLVANKDLLATAGIKMDLMGGTDGTDHQLLKSKSYHEAKAKALKQLLAFQDAGKLNVAVGSIDLAAGSATRKLIEDYIKETAAGKGYDFVKTNKDAFTKAGKIFDAALAVQRAEDMKKRLSNDKDDAFGVEEKKDDNGGVTYKLKEGESGLAIELGSTKDKEEERKSGLNFSAAEKKADNDDNDKDEDTPGPDAPVPAPGPDAPVPAPGPDAPAADPDAPAADPDAPPAPGSGQTPEKTADAAATTELNTKIGEAKTAIEAKIKAVDDAIDQHEGMLTQGPAKDKMEGVRKDLNATFTKVNNLLKTAGEKAKAGNIDEAQKDYDQAAKILQDKLEEAQQQDAQESYLNKNTRDAILDLRKEVEARKPGVKAAFEKKKETLSKVK